MNSNDITIPENLKDGCLIISEHRLRELTSFLFKDGICPVSDEIRKEIEPMKLTSSETVRCFGLFNAVYKGQSSYFVQRPLFTILYASRCLQSKKLFDAGVEFLTVFLQNFEDASRFEEVLDIIIPFTIYRQYIIDKPPVIIPFMTFLCKKFGTKIFMRHLLTLLESMANNEDGKVKIGYFHIDLLLAIFQNFELSQYEVDRIDENILAYLVDDDTMPMKVSVSSLTKAIETTPTRRISAMTSPRDPPAYRRKAPNFDKLNIYLDEVESHLYASVPTVISQIRHQLERLKQWPEDRSPKRLFELALQSYPGPSEVHRSNVFTIISFMNQNLPPEQILPLYLDAAYDDKINLEFADRCYQEFRIGAELDNAPPTLYGKPPRQGESPPKTSLKYAFESLSVWDTAYDGVQKIWTAITKNRDVDLAYFFNDLEYSQKSYLIQGLKAIQETCEPIPGTKSAIAKLESLMVDDSASQTSSNRGSSPRRRRRSSSTKSSPNKALSQASSIKSPKSPKVSQESSATRTPKFRP